MGAFNDRLKHDEGFGGRGGGGGGMKDCQRCTAQLIVDLLAHYNLSCYPNTDTQQHTNCTAATSDQLHP